MQFLKVGKKANNMRYTFLQVINSCFENTKNKINIVKVLILEGNQKILEGLKKLA